MLTGGWRRADGRPRSRSVGVTVSYQLSITVGCSYGDRSTNTAARPVVDHATSTIGVS